MENRKRMWNWSTNKSRDTSYKSSLAGTPFKLDYTPTPKPTFNPPEFNLRAHYQQLKENHPYYQ